MASTVSSVADPLAAKFIKHTGSTTTVAAEDHVPGTGSNTTYGFQCENLGTAAAYLKLDDSTNATAASSQEEIRLYAPAGSTVSYLVGSGFIFGAGISYWITTTAASSTTQTAPSDSVTVKILSTA